MSLGLVDIQAIRGAVKSTLVAGLPSKVNVYENDVDNPTGPFVSIVAGEPYITYYATAGPAGRTIVNLVLEVGAGGAANAINTQIKLDDFLSIATPLSIVSIFDDDKTLGGVVESCLPLQASGPTREFPFARIPLQIFARKGGN